MAGARQPIDLLIAKGRKHLSEAEIEQRRETEVRAPIAKRAKVPSYLAKGLVPKFKKLSRALIDINILADIDADCLARYLMAENTYLVLTKKMFTILATDDISEDEQLEKIDSISAMQDRYFKQCRAAAMDLGLTISSRCKLVMPRQFTATQDEDADLFG